MANQVCSPCLRDQHDRCTGGVCKCQCKPAANGVVVWEEPPPIRRGKPIMSAEQIAALKAEPKRWARVQDYGKASTAGQTASNYKAGKTALEPGFELVGRKDDKGGSVLYARWLGRVAA